MISGDCAAATAGSRWDGTGEIERILAAEAKLVRSGAWRLGFVVELENGARIYFAGDTNVFGDMRIIGELYRPDIAILPIGGHYTMGPREAALAVQLLGVGEVLPIHYGTFPILTGTPGQLRDELASRGLGEVVVHALEPGQTIRR